MPFSELLTDFDGHDFMWITDASRSKKSLGKLFIEVRNDVYCYPYVSAKRQKI